MSANAHIAAFAVVLSVVSLCGYAPLASSQDSNEGNSDEHGFKGMVAPARSYDIAPPFDGQVIEIRFKPGEYVEKGQLLFTLDSTKAELELERDKAQLLRAEAQLRIAEVILKKNEQAPLMCPAGQTRISIPCVIEITDGSGTMKSRVPEVASSLCTYEKGFGPDRRSA